MESQSLSIQKIASYIFVIAAILFVSYLLKPVFAPLLLATIIALAFLPIVNWLEKHGFNRLFSSFTTVAGLGLFFLGIATIGYFQLRQFIKEYPNLEMQFFRKLNEFTQLLPQGFKPPTLREVEDIEKILPNDLTTLEPFFSGVLALSGDLITTLTMLPIYLFFILFYRAKIVRFSAKIESSYSGNIHQVMHESKEVIQKYLSGLGLVVLIIALLATIGLWALGIEYAFLLGSLSAILTIIPYIGTLAGAIIPIVIAFLTKDAAAYGFAVMALYAVIQIAEANIITPLIMGNNVNINPFVSILVLLIMSQFWGVIGMIVAIPLTAIIIVTTSHSNRFSAINLLLKNDV